MYLLTFALIMIAVLGTYVQVYAVEVARMFANQTGYADTLITWHHAATSLASNVVDPSPGGIPLTGCSLSSTLLTLPFCPLGPLSVATPATGSVTVTGHTYTNPTGNVFPQWASNYNTNVYNWNTIAYLQGTTNYAVTFVLPAATAATDISTANPVQIPITAGNLMHQLQNSGLPSYAYGYVSTVGGNQTLVTSALINPTTALTYTLPVSGLVVPSNSVAIISTFTSCTSC